MLLARGHAGCSARINRTTDQVAALTEEVARSQRDSPRTERHQPPDHVRTDSESSQWKGAAVSYEGYTGLRIEVTDGIATILIDNPPINLFDRTDLSEIKRVADEVATDDDVSAWSCCAARFLGSSLLTSILHIQEMSTKGTDIDQTRGTWTDMCESFRTMPKATVAVIEGRAGGGGNELALHRRATCASPHERRLSSTSGRSRSGCFQVAAV